MSSSRYQAPLTRIFSDFQKALRPHIKDAHVIAQMTQRIEMWAGPTAELVSIVCLEIVQNALSIDENQPEASVDRIIKEGILAYWEGSLAAQHLGAIATTLRKKENKDLRLLSYLKILQRGSVPQTNSTEQTDLLACGLVSAEGSTLKVTNAIYTYIFDAHWIEEQIPGITRPVTVKKSSVSSQVPIDSPFNSQSYRDSKQPSTASGLYSKLAVLACCIAVFGSVISAYRYKPGDDSFATQATRQTMASLKAKADPLSSGASNQQAGQPFPLGETTTTRQPNEPIAITTTDEITTDNITTVEPITDRMLFDKGIEHATNSRWLPMVREFCQLSPSATYTTLAKRQLASWVTLYREDIEIAQTTFTQEEGRECSLVSEALSTASVKAETAAGERATDEQ